MLLITHSTNKSNMAAASGKRAADGGDGGAGKKKKRSTPFTGEENETLIGKIINYYNNLFGAAAKKTSQGKKAELWRKVTDAVNSVGGNGRTVEVIKKRYFDVKRQVKRKIARADQAARGTGGGPAQEADLSDYEKELFSFLGPEQFEGVLGSTDTDVPRPSGSSVSAVEQPQPPPEPQDQTDRPPEPTLVERFASLASGEPLPDDQPGPSHQPPGAALSPGSTTTLSSKGPLSVEEEEEAEDLILTVVDPPADNTTAAAPGPASVPAQPSTLADLVTHLRGIAEDLQRRAVPSAESLEREQELQRQHVQYQAETVSLLREMSGELRAFRTRDLPRLCDLISQHVEAVRVIGAGMLGSTPHRLFPSMRAEHAQRDEGSDDDD